MRDRDHGVTIGPITPEAALAGYRRGIFPMAPERDSPLLHWIEPGMRGIVPLGGFHISRSLARRMRRGGYAVRVDSAFAAVVEACADRPETWINPALSALYATLFARGQAHSFEVWQGGALAGGVFGIALGGAFFGESMVSRRNDGSKLALAHLVAALRAGGFVLFDTQFLTPHLARLGAVEIPATAYRRRLAAALGHEARFPPPGPLGQSAATAPASSGSTHDSTQTS